jgi:hypothetical protein
MVVMMAEFIQQILVIGIVSFSVIYLARSYWRKRQTKSGCQSCKLMQTTNQLTKSKAD